jgi:hypothetical protein
MAHAGRFSIFHFSFFICHRRNESLSEPMTNGITKAAHRLESGLVRLERRGTSALSKRRAEKRRAEKLRAEKLLNQWQVKNKK